MRLCTRRRVTFFDEIVSIKTSLQLFSRQLNTSTCSRITS
jgi:hypothetical protein